MSGVIRNRKSPLQTHNDRFPIDFDLNFEEIPHFNPYSRGFAADAVWQKGTLVQGPAVRGTAVRVKPVSGRVSRGRVEAYTRLRRGFNFRGGNTVWQFRTCKKTVSTDGLLPSKTLA